MATLPHDQDTAALRAFIRFSTQRFNLFNRRLHDGPLGLTEARVLYEIGEEPGVTAVRLAHRLAMDHGQLSRTLKRLQKHGYVDRDETPAGRTPRPLRLTDEGLALLVELAGRADAQAAALLAHLDETRRARLRVALGEVQALLTDHPHAADRVRLRPARAGDLGWVIMRHAQLYASEQGYTAEFERYVLEGVAEFSRMGDSDAQLWIAERAGAPLGCVAVVARGEATSQLRWLLVEPVARGLGVGRMLVRHAMAFARKRGDAALLLWTVNELTPARRLYAALGFELVESRPGVMGGLPTTEECWRVALPRLPESSPNELDARDDAS